MTQGKIHNKSIYTPGSGYQHYNIYGKSNLQLVIPYLNGQDWKYQHWNGKRKMGVNGESASGYPTPLPKNTLKADRLEFDLFSVKLKNTFERRKISGYHFPRI